MVGYVHDHGSDFTGQHSGLGALLNDFAVRPFLDLCDVCHSLNLALVQSLKTLPQELTGFLEKISRHFAYPQRQVYLHRVQVEKKLPRLSTKDYVSTRWLSLGSSLDRIIQIWENLHEYVKRKPEFSGLKDDDDDFTYFNDFLESCFHNSSLLLFRRLMSLI